MAALDLGKFPTASGILKPAVTPVNPLAAKLNLESMQGLSNEKGPAGQPRVPTGTFGNLGDIQTSGSGLNFSAQMAPAPTDVVTPSVYAMSSPVQQLPTIQPPAAATGPAPVTPAAPVATPAATQAAAKPIAAPNFLPTLGGPNTVQDIVSEGRDLMNTQGIGGFVQAKGLNRMAQTINQANAPLIAGQYGLQNTAMTDNDRLEQAKLAEQYHQQNQETWTPDKNMMGELLGYGRTKGGTPQYVTKESLMAKPTLAQFLAKARPVNPKATDAELTAHYNATYATE